MHHQLFYCQPKNTEKYDKKKTSMHKAQNRGRPCVQQINVPYFHSQFKDYTKLTKTNEGKQLSSEADIYLIHDQ